jgi:hypothetical protein
MTSLILEYTLQDLAMMSPSLSNSSRVRHFRPPHAPVDERRDGLIVSRSEEEFDASIVMIVQFFVEIFAKDGICVMQGLRKPSRRCRPLAHVLNRPARGQARDDG